MKYPAQWLVLLLNRVLLINPNKVKKLDLAASVPTLAEVLAVVNHPQEVVVISQEASQEAKGVVVTSQEANQEAKGEVLTFLQEVVVIAVAEAEVVRPQLTLASTALECKRKNDNKIINSFTFT